MGILVALTIVYGILPGFLVNVIVNSPVHRLPGAPVGGRSDGHHLPRDVRPRSSSSSAAALLVFLLDVLGVRQLETFGAIAVSATSLALLGRRGRPRVRAARGPPDHPASVGRRCPSGPRSIAFTSLGLIFQAIFLTSALLVSLASLARPSDEKGAAVFFGLLLMATVGMLLAAVATDLIFLLLAVEVTGIATYLLVGYTRKDARSLEAAMKFYIVGALSSVALVLRRLAPLRGVRRHELLRAGDLRPASVGFPVLALAGYAFLIAGLGFKLTLVPFHAWAVDVYDGAPDDVSPFLAGGSKKIGVFAFFLVFLGSGPVFAPVARAVGARAATARPHPRPD